MSSSSVLVNLADDADLRLVSLLTEGNESLQSTCTDCVSDSTKLAQLLVSAPSAMERLSNLDNEDSMGALSLLAGLIQRSEAPVESKDSLTTALADAVVGSATSKDDLETTQKKLNLLSILYNMLDTKCNILIRLFQVASTHKATLLHPESTLGRMISTDEPPITKIVQDWNSSDRCRVYQAVCEVLGDDETFRRQRFLLLLLTEQASVAREVAIGAIRDPVSLFRWQRSLLSVPAIQALKKDEPDLHRLLEIFQTGKLADYLDFFRSKDEAKVLSRWGLKPEDCQRYMRMLSLCSLAADHDEIPYGEIQTTLQHDDVESWVVDAVNSGLLQAKMDQLSQKVMVERCVVRKFDVEQWKRLQSRLAMWKKNVGSVLAALDQSKAVPSS